MSKKKWFKRIGVGAVIAVVAYASLVITPFGHRSVIWSVGGVSYEERQPGLSFIVPFVQRYHPVVVREQRYITVDVDGKANAFVQSKDLQEITVRASLVYKVDPTQAAELYDDVGPFYEEAIIEPIFFDAVKEAGGQRVALSFAEELASIADDIDAIVTPQLAARGIQVMSVALEDAVFDPQFIESVKNKVIALQREQETITLVRIADNEAQTILLKGQAEADVQDALAASVTPDVVCYELAKQGVKCVPEFVGGDSPFIFDLGTAVE